MFKFAPIALAVALSLGSFHSAAAQTFDQATEAMLMKSKEAKSGVVIHLDGQTIGAYVVELQAEFIVVANREHSRIVIRRSSIDAISAP